jgi:hypothetical protein
MKTIRASTLTRKGETMLSKSRNKLKNNCNNCTTNSNLRTSKANKNKTQRAEKNPKAKPKIKFEIDCLYFTSLQFIKSIHRHHNVILLQKWIIKESKPNGSKVVAVGLGIVIQT